MLKTWSERQRRLLVVAVLSAAIVVADIIAVNIAGELSEFWWVLAVPIGLLLVGLVGIVSAIWLVTERRARAG